MFYDLVHVASVLCLVAQSCPTLCDLMGCNPPGFSVHGDSPGRNTGVGCHALLQGICQTQESKPGLPHCRWILHYLSQQESPRILEWVAYPFSRRSSQPRNWTRVSCTADVFFTGWATRKAPSTCYLVANSICPWKDCIPQLLDDCCSVTQSWLFMTQWIAACHAFLSFTISQSLLKFMSTESLMLFNHLILCHSLLLCLQSFPALGYFLMSLLFPSDGQHIGALASASLG